jgi:hypothetical protein
MKTIRVNEAAYQMMCASAADRNLTVSGAVQVRRATQSHPGVWQMEVGEDVYARLLELAPPDVSDALLTVCKKA